MKILITGMSGTGKTAVIHELQARDFAAIDLDTPDWSHWVDVAPTDGLTPSEGKDWVWQEERVRSLLSRPDDGMLFISGCAENMHRLYPLIDRIILLSAPIDTIMARLEKRSTDGYGNTAEERARIAELIATIEPLLRAAAHHEIDSSGPVATTTDRLLRLLDR
ncbi:MAG: AAA family ATPase [Pseudomonadota bacterium]